MKFAIIGSALSGNKGAAAMLESSLQTLGKKYPDATFTLLTVYPEEDKRLNTYNNLSILSASPLYLALVLNPAALLYKILPPLRSILLKKSPQLKAIVEADALLDQGGITFTDGRELFLIYNIATVLPALLVGTKVIKCAQALGPFKNPFNRIAAELMLPKMALIIARGKITHQYLHELKFQNVVLATDYAFSLDITPADEQEGQRVLRQKRTAAFADRELNVGISPSVVVKKKCDKKSIDYIGLMQWFIDDLIRTGYIVTLVPHSVRSNTDKPHNNDLPLCQEIYQGINNKEQCTFIDTEVSSQALRYIIGQTDMFVACRFHAMISSLAQGVPTLVLGWSHKYSEILDLFGVAEFGIDALTLSKQTLSDNFEKLAASREELAVKLRKEIPDIRKLSVSHVDLISAVIENKNQT